jgi:two-component system, CitB family, sensor kinase
MRRRSSRLVRQLLALGISTVLLTVAFGAVLSLVSTQRAIERGTSDRVLAAAQAMAAQPAVVAAVKDGDPAGTLQPVAEDVRQRTGVDFVVVMSRDGIRYTHPTPSEIGQHYIGSISQAAAGQPYVEHYVGTLGPSVRAIVPIWDGGTVVGMVSVGVLEEQMAAELRRQLPLLLGVTAAALVIGCAIAWWVAGRVKRQTLGLEPHEITNAYQHHEAVLHAIREGLLVVDADGRVVLVNDEGRRLLKLTGEVNGRGLHELGVEPELARRIHEGDPIRDEMALVGERILLVNQEPAAGEPAEGSRVITLRDHTELESVLRQLDDTRSVAEALTSQAHEFANRMQNVVTLVELGEHHEAVRSATGSLRLADGLAAGVREQIADPTIAAHLADKVWTAREQGIELRLTDGSCWPADSGWPADDLVTVLGNLLDNAIDAVAGAAGGWVAVTVRAEAEELLIVVRDSGPGIAAADAATVFDRGWSTKQPTAGRTRGVGLALVKRIVDRLGGKITVEPGPGAVFTVRVPSGATSTVQGD